MAFLDDRDAAALAFRVEAIINNRPATIGGPITGERNLLHDKLEEILAAVRAGGLSQEVITSLTTAVSTAAKAGAGAAINGATIRPAP